MTTPPGGRPLRVVVVDDQPLMRSGFSLILSGSDDLEVVGEAADGQEALDRAAELRPDVVLMDVRMPVMDGIEATRRIVADDLARVLVLTTFDDDDHLFDSLAAGASGFLLKNSDPDDLVDAVRTVGHGHALLAPEVTRRVLARVVDDPRTASAVAEVPPSPAPASSEAAGLEQLTARETEVLGLVAEGLSNGEIAERLHLGEATVKTHVSSCLSKLHLRDRVQAVVFAFRAGLGPPRG